MKNYPLTINKAILFACLSMYFGTGWSLALFSFPIAPKLTPANYYNQFVPQVAAATHFFTYMTMVMMLCCAIFIIEKFRSADKWYPILILLLTILTTAITIKYIFPYNNRMSAGITDPIELQSVLHTWIQLNIVRVCIWTAMWMVMMVYYSVLLVKSYKFQAS
jgi:magnesium-transporting ATPase (P-type)